MRSSDWSSDVCSSDLRVSSLRRLRSRTFGVYPAAATASSTCVRVSSETISGFISARLTVAVETPASRATSFMVAGMAAVTAAGAGCGGRVVGSFSPATAISGPQPALAAVEQHQHQEGRAEDDLAAGRIDGEGGQDALQQDQHHGTGPGAEIPAGPARERRAADDHGDDRRQAVLVADAAEAADGVAEEEDAGRAGEQPAKTDERGPGERNGAGQ